MFKINVILFNVVNIVIKERKKKRYIGVMIVYVGLIVYFIVIVYFLFWMIISFFKSIEEIFIYSWFMLYIWLIENYVIVWKSGIFFYFLNSVIVMGVFCFLMVLVSVLGVYGLLCFEF